MLGGELTVDQLMFEALSTTLQAYFVRRVGSEVNLGNVAASDVIPLETMRLGLRADTLTVFEGAVR